MDSHVAMLFLATECNKMTTLRREDWRVSHVVLRYFQWHFIKYTWQQLARLLTGSLQWLHSAMLIRFIDYLSVSDCFQPLRTKMANDGINVTCMLADNVSTWLLCQMLVQALIAIDG